MPTDVDAEATALLTLQVPCDRHAPGRVRAALGETNLQDGVRADAMLIASELVTNAVRHSGGQPHHTLSIRAALAANRLLISVHDPGVSGSDVQQREPDLPGGELRARGYGLMIVDQLSLRWGTERDEGHRVWAELDAST